MSAPEKFTYLANMDVAAAEHLYHQFLTDPSSVSPDWKLFFEGVDFARTHFGESAAPSGPVPDGMAKEFNVINLINAYRKNGHLFTRTNPVRERRKFTPTLAIENFGLNQSDLDTVFQAGSQLGLVNATLRQIIDHLWATYCQSIGSEYMYIRRADVVEWIQKHLEPTRNQPGFSLYEKQHILYKLNQAVQFEQFLDRKFPGQKRFSIEGAESLIPALEMVVEEGAELGIEEFVVGMAHRGRLNVLTNIFLKTYDAIFSEFEGKDYDDEAFEGDVKYHMGYTSYDITDSGKKVKLNLCPNPSHLEAVDPVVEGISRAKIDRKYAGDNSRLCPILIHGDAAIAGQGVVYEVIQMAKLDGYQTGGTIHIVINNQVGFTTN
jgi:2-oxoglutarate dehydrogenase E1 component